MKKVIEQGVSFIDIQHLTKTVLIYEKFNSRPEGKIITIDKPKAREVALAICPELESKLAEKDKEIERLKDEKNEALRLLNDALKLIHSLPDLLHDSLGDHTAGNDYEIISINGERWINHKVVGSGEPLKQWIKSEIENLINGSK